MRKGILITIFTIFTVNLFAQTELKSLKDIANYGIDKNLDYRTSILSLVEAEDDIETIFTLDETELTTSIEYDNDSLTNPEELSIEVEIPFFDQFTFTGDIDEDLSGDLEFSFEPFSITDSKVQSELDYKTALINTESALLTAESDAVMYALYWMNNQKDYVVQRRNWQLQEIVYNDDKSRYEAGDITLDDLKDSLIEWSESRKDFITSEQEYKKSEKELYEALGSTLKDVKVNILTIEELENSLLDLKSSINLESIGFLKSSDWRLSSISVESAKESYNKTWVYEPDLTADFEIPYDEESGIKFDEFTATLSLTVAIDDFDITARDIAEEKYNISVLENTLALNEAEVDFNQAINVLESNKISSEIFRIEYEQAELLYAEAMLLYSSGNYSLIELEESEIYLLEGEISLFNALVTEYLSWLDLKNYL